MNIIDRLNATIESEDGYWPLCLARDARDEISRLTAENERLETVLDHQALGPTLSKWQNVRSENERLRTELDQLKSDSREQSEGYYRVVTERDALRAALQEITQVPLYLQSRRDNYANKAHKMNSIAEAALKTTDSTTEETP